MLEEKNYKNLDMIFPFLPGFMDSSRGWVKKAALTIMNELYFEIMLSMT